MPYLCIIGKQICKIIMYLLFGNLLYFPGHLKQKIISKVCKHNIHFEHTISDAITTSPVMSTTQASTNKDSVIISVTPAPIDNSICSSLSICETGKYYDKMFCSLHNF